MEAADGENEIPSEVERGFSHTVNKIVYVFSKVRDVLNSNSSIKALNNLTFAFEDMISSQGWLALDLFINTMGNSLTVFDVIASTVERVLGKKRMKQEDRDKAIEEMDTSTVDSQDELKQFMQQMVTQFTEVNTRMKCLLEAHAEYAKGNQIFKDCSHFPEEDDALPVTETIYSLMDDEEEMDDEDEMASNEFENENENNLEFDYYGDPYDYYYLPTRD